MLTVCGFIIVSSDSNGIKLAFQKKLNPKEIEGIWGKLLIFMIDTKNIIKVA